MTQEDKRLLLIDLSGRLPYNVKVRVTYWDKDESITDDVILNEIDTRYPSNLYWLGGNQLQEHGISPGTTSFASNSDDDDEIVKPYLRPMSSMSFEEKAYCFAVNEQPVVYIDWLNEHHFDYRGLIEKGLALEAPEGMYEFN